MITFIHVLVVVPDGRVLLQRLVDKWEATLSRVATDSKTAPITAKTCAVTALGLSFIDKRNVLEPLTESYDKKKDVNTLSYIIRLKSNTVISVPNYREAKVMSLEELVDVATKYSDTISHRTHYMIDVFRDLRIVRPR